jgi:hypothetical protein
MAATSGSQGVHAASLLDGEKGPRASGGLIYSRFLTAWSTNLPGPGKYSAEEIEDHDSKTDGRFLAVIAEIRQRNCEVPQEVFQLLKEAGVYTDSLQLAEPYRCSRFIP